MLNHTRAKSVSQSKDRAAVMLTASGLVLALILVLTASISGAASAPA